MKKKDYPISDEFKEKLDAGLKQWKIPVTWEFAGEIYVEAPTLEDAYEMIQRDEDINGDPFNLPDEHYYIDGSFGHSCDNVEDLYDYQNH